ncbi:ricin-type beta-trefoil lectin domain protein [Neisseria animaloris]|uniref:ricin-type beta-trefoil lectin domain protein n=1 Tax=Neisseria animaloris TaxID=326522 RepID=UPI000D36627C|nr:ricin-type beta-trefoil lectin domain protein [Neisseria animaloris]
MKLQSILLIPALLLGGCLYVGPDGYPRVDIDDRYPDHRPDDRRDDDRPSRFPQGRTVLIETDSGKCLDRGRGSYKGLISYDCHGENNQRFTMSDRSIRVEGLCLDVANEKDGDGAEVIAYKCHGGLNQQWYRDGYTIRSRMNGKCLDAGKYGNQVRMHRCDGSRDQDFYLIRR